ncbi:MAG TPA: phospholipase D-like domain-containing protein [Ktedonobacterales bacterium]
MPVTDYSSPDLHAYFHSKRAGLDGQLVARVVAFIQATQATLDCAIYDLRHPEVVAALAQVAARPHVRVRIAFDGSGERNGGLTADPKPSGTHQAIDQAGLSGHATAIHEHGRHLMHDKFLVRDGQAVWVGSANMTVGGLELQDNNCLEIQSPALAATYTATFEELISPAHEHNEHGGARHADAHASAMPAPIPVDRALLTPYFAPAAGEGIEDTLVAALKHARRIRIFAFLLSDPGILAAIAPHAADHSFDIRGVYDPHGMQDVLRYSRPGGHAEHAGRTGKSAHASQADGHFWFLYDPRFVAAPSHGFAVGREQDFMHNKVIVIDDHLVFTGSYNFSENAEDNDETMLAIESPALAAAYTAYFDALTSAYSGAAAGTPVREPVAVGAGARASAVAGEDIAAAAAPAVGAHTHAHGDDVVANLRSEHSRSEQVASPASKRPRPQRVSRRATRRETPAWVESAIRIVLILMALTALALVAFTALTLGGVLLFR